MVRDSSASRQDVNGRVCEIVSSKLQIPTDRLPPDSHFIYDLGADSLDVTEIAVALEDEFGIKLPEKDFRQLTTLSQTVEYVRSRVE